MRPTDDKPAPSVFPGGIPAHIEGQLSLGDVDPLTCPHYGEPCLAVPCREQGCVAKRLRALDPG